MVAQLPHLASLASAHDRLGLLIEVVLLGFRLLGFGCSTFATLRGFTIEEVAEVKTHIFEELGIPLVGEEVEVIVAEGVIVLDSIGFQLLDRRIRCQYLARHLLKA